MIREMTLMFALGLMLAACGSDDDGDSSTNTPTSSAGGTAGSGGTAGGGAGGTAGSGGTASNGSGGSTTTGNSGDRVCEAGCEATLEADCENGPDDLEQCVSDCKALIAGGCTEQYSAFQACAEGETVTCGAQGIPVVAACADEQAAFITCINQ